MFTLADAITRAEVAGAMARRAADLVAAAATDAPLMAAASRVFARQAVEEVARAARLVGDGFAAAGDGQAAADGVALATAVRARCAPADLGRDVDRPRRGRERSCGRGTDPAMPTGRHEITAADDRFLASFAAAIARRRLAAPTVLLLEWLKPVSFLGSQVMHVLGAVRRPGRIVGGLGAALGPDGAARERRPPPRAPRDRRRAAGPGGAAEAAAPDGAYVVTDCGSTTTKAVLFVQREGRYRLAGRAESPTTVESPVEDVCCGVRNALALLQDQTGHVFLAEDGETLIPATGPAAACAPS